VRTRPQTSPPNDSPQASLAGRAAILVVVLVALLVSLALPVRELITQRARAAELSEHNASVQAQVDALNAAKVRWQDPAYIAAQARERLHYVNPGDTAYVVVEPDPQAPQAAVTSSGSAQPWYVKLWHTVTRSDSPPAAQPYWR